MISFLLLVESRFLPNKRKQTMSAPRKGKDWFPLESNPDVMNPYVAKLGFPADKFSFVDVLSTTEEWALDMVPRPVLAVLLLFPIKEASEKFLAEEREKIEAEGQTVAAPLYFTKQVVGNACGTIGLLHSVANSSTFCGGPVEVKEGSFFDAFLKRTLAMTPEARAVALEDDAEIEESHELVAQEGQSAVVMDVNSHFIAFVQKEGCLYELDGRKAFPINHGPSSPDTLLLDACAVINKFMARDEGEMGFAVTALAAVDSDGAAAAGGGDAE